MSEKRIHQLKPSLDFDLSIIIVNYHSYGNLLQCLNSLPIAFGKLKTEIIVIDNTEKSARKKIDGLLDSMKKTKIIFAKKNLGYAGGVNLGVKNSSGKYTAVINPDVTMVENCLEELFKFMEKHPKIGMVGPKLLTLDGKLHLSCRTFPGPFILFYKRIPLIKYLPGIRNRIGRHMMTDYNHEKPRRVDWISGSFMFIRRETIENIGPMDEHFFLYFEDVDWCRRTFENGWQVWYYPKVKAVHQAQHLSTQFGFLGFFRKISWIHLSSYFKYFYKYGKAKLIRHLKESIRPTT